MSGTGEDGPLENVGTTALALFWLLFNGLLGGGMSWLEGTVTGREGMMGMEEGTATGEIAEMLMVPGGLAGLCGGREARLAAGTCIAWMAPLESMSAKSVVYQREIIRKYKKKESMSRRY